MASGVTRREFLGKAGSVAAVGAGTAAGAALAADPTKPTQPNPTESKSTASKPIKIIAICGSPRKGKSTAMALQVCLDAAKQVDPRIEVELIELAGMKIDGSLAAGLPLEPGQRDDFPKLVPVLADPKVAGIIVGTPVYFGNMTSLCKAFLDRCMAFREADFALSNKVAGVLAVGGCRNGGQELTIASVQAALMCQEMIIVGDGRPTVHRGATLWSGIEGGIANDQFGLSTAQNLGRRVAEVALRVAG
jgi:multimeric flavodoxin WrbA